MIQPFNKKQPKYSVFRGIYNYFLQPNHSPTKLVHTLDIHRYDLAPSEICSYWDIAALIFFKS